MKDRRCAGCRFFYADDRITPYRRDPMFFCRKKGALFSRNYAVHEQNGFCRKIRRAPSLKSGELFLKCVANLFLSVLLFHFPMLKYKSSMFAF